MRRRIAIIVAALSISVASSFTFAAPAQAAYCGELAQEACSIVLGTVCRVTGRLCIR